VNRHTQLHPPDCQRERDRLVGVHVETADLEPLQFHGLIINAGRTYSVDFCYDALVERHHHLGVHVQADILQRITHL
jgi:hypothetical protein